MCQILLQITRNTMKKQLHNFLNAIEKQWLKAEGDKNKAIKKSKSVNCKNK